MDSFRKLFSIGEQLQQQHSPTRPATPEEVRMGGEYLLELKKKDVIQNLEKETGLMPYYVGGSCLAGSMIPFLSRKMKVKGEKGVIGKIFRSRLGMGVLGAMIGFNVSSMIQLNHLKRDDPEGKILKELFECVQLKDKSIITEDLSLKLSQWEQQGGRPSDFTIYK